MMQTITFTTNDQIGQLLHTIATENNKPTSEVIADSLRYYSEMLQKRKWQQQIKHASSLVAEQSLDMSQLLEASNADGL
jgi:predicted transcriptional regulator